MSGMGEAAAHLPEALTDAAWCGFINWAFGYADIRARFRSETGLSLDVLDGRSPIEALVDKVSGHSDDLLWRFVEWATIEIWGLEYAPVKYREELQRRAVTP